MKTRLIKRVTKFLSLARLVGICINANLIISKPARNITIYVTCKCQVIPELCMLLDNLLYEY